MTPTVIGLADIVLPASTFFEHDGMVTNNNSSQPGQFGATPKILESAGESRGDLEIIIDLHKRIYPNSIRSEWADAQSLLSSDMAKIKGVDITYLELQEKIIGQYELDYKKFEKGYLRADGSMGFNTPTGRIELWSTILQRLGDDPLPYYIEPKFSAIVRPDLEKDYPLILTSGARRYTSFHSENRHIETLREIHPYGNVQINPATAAKYSITDNEWVWIETPWGKFKSKSELTPIVKENVISADHGWWYPEKDPNNLFDNWDYSVNNAIPHEENGPLGFGTLYKSLPAKIYPAA
jgi:anaerobic selenocysteine-containing dehydrogenase